MQKQVDEEKARREEAEEAGIDYDSTQKKGQDVMFSFMPTRARSVPDFRSIQKSFITKMEQKKKSKQPTKPIPFKFNQARPSAKLRTHMDHQNQVINPTLTKRRANSARCGQEQRDQQVEQPATTAKHDARVEMNRKKIDQARKDKDDKFQEDVLRYLN